MWAPARTSKVGAGLNARHSQMVPCAAGVCPRAVVSAVHNACRVQPQHQGRAARGCLRVPCRERAQAGSSRQAGRVARRASIALSGLQKRGVTRCTCMRVVELLCLHLGRGACPEQGCTTPLEAGGGGSGHLLACGQQGEEEQRHECPPAGTRAELSHLTLRS